MAVSDIVPVPGTRFEDTLESASPDLLREMIKGFAQRMMDAEVEAVCGAGYGEVTPERVNSRNGYRRREQDTRAGTAGLAVPKLRQGTYYPEWLLERRRRAERALATVVATSYLLGVSTRRVEKLAESLGVTKLSKSQVSVMAAELDEMVASFRSRPLDAGPYTFAWIDALTQKVREGGRTANVHALIATAVNADGKRGILGLDVATAEDGAGWLAFLRGLAGVPARPGRPRPVRRAAGHLRLPSRAAGRDRRGAARRVLAEVSCPLLPELGYPGAQVGAAVGVDAGQDHLRAARRRVRPRPACPGRHRPGGKVPAGSRPPL
jgi:Transposase, Mutator family